MSLWLIDSRKEKSRPILTENNSELKSSDNVAKDTSQEKENSTSVSAVLFTVTIFTPGKASCNFFSIVSTYFPSLGLCL
jgi:hypothetical protein